MSGAIGAITIAGQWAYTITVGQGTSPTTHYGYRRPSDNYGSIVPSLANPLSGAPYKISTVSRFVSLTEDNSFEFVLAEDSDSGINTDATFTRIIVVGDSTTFTLVRSAASFTQLSLTGSIWTWGSLGQDVWNTVSASRLVVIQ